VGVTPTEGSLQAATGPDDAAPDYFGLQESAVQDLYDAAGRVMGKQLDSLRRLERDAAGRLRAATLETQQLERFLDEVRYRERFVADLLTRATESEAAALR
jgi:YD repeat-containing protein